MITPSMIYWINTLGNIKAVCVLFSVLSVFISFASFLAMAVWEADYNFDRDDLTLTCVKHYFLAKKIFIRSIIVAPILIIAATFIPDRKTMYQMYIIPTVTNSKIAQQLPAQIEQYIQTVLKDKTS